MKNSLKFFSMLLLGSLAFSGCGSSNNESSKETVMETKDQDAVVVMETSMGTMKIKLYNETPRHRDNFLKLADAKYYDGLRFHRVIADFMIQGGDPYSKDLSKVDMWGTGGPEYTIPAEFVSSLHHKKGALAAARQGDVANPRRASSGSQFYIVQSEQGCKHLDGQYTVFGEVIDGLDVIDKIAAVETDPYDRPMTEVIMTKVYRFQPVVEAAADSTARQDSTAAADSASAE